MRIAACEYTRFADLLHSLSTDDWSSPTDCPDWDVRAMATHVLGMAEMCASLRENIRQNRTARRQGGVFIDAPTRFQVEERSHLSSPEIVARFAAVTPRAARGRRRTPGFVRRRAMPILQPAGDRLEPWTFGYLIDVILSRDTWMHRIDIARATGCELVLTADHDGVLVADVAAEWAERHGQACTLTLTGPAGGSWVWGTGGPQLELDAVEATAATSRHLATGRRQAELTGHTGAVHTVAFSPDGRLLASGDDETMALGGPVRLWDMASGRQQAELGGHTGAVLDVAFSPDGRLVAAGGPDNPAVVDLTTQP
jgi:uncharacterized protein (TIGR03083 family)